MTMTECTVCGERSDSAVLFRVGCFACGAAPWEQQTRADEDNRTIAETGES